MDLRHTQAVIDLTAIKDNLKTIRTRLVNPGTGIMAVVKANAYGHGLNAVAETALSAGCSHLAVALPDEGVALRQAGIAAPVIVLGLIAPEEADVCARHNLTVTVCADEHLPPLAAAAKKTGRPVGVMLKADTGMNRIGANHADAIKLAGRLKKMTGLHFFGLFTHFASAGGPDLAYAKEQLGKFRGLVFRLEELGLRPPLVSAAASGAIFTLPDSQFDLVRAGIAMYGLYPSDFIAARYKLSPALQLITRISHINDLPAAAPVSYEMTWRAKEDCRIAVLPLGYGDGYSRLLSNRAEVLIGGRRCAVAGNVCMDQLMVCLGANDDVRVGDQAVLIGRQGGDAITLEELARAAGTVNYELACNIAARVPRVYI
ncbi:MAG: alanine racemase [Acidaminococcales bacterium]|jgi:alanine racemase|nr:alanine racemase [Acidaminococcales bacterium]